MHGPPSRNALFVLALAGLMLLPAGACALQGTRAGALRPAQSILLRVTRVTDGDTFHVVRSGRDERVRLIGVNTPEVSGYGGPAECFGEAAAAYTTERLLGRRVRLEFDVDRRDRYGRLLAYVYLGRELFNLTLVRRGFARADEVPPDLRMAGTFAAVERGARDTQTGLWSACPME